MGFPDDIGLDLNDDLNKSNDPFRKNGFIAVLVFYGYGGKLLGNPINPKNKTVWIKASDEEIGQNKHFEMASDLIKKVDYSTPLALFDSRNFDGMNMLKLFN